jgi:hypothetical protein
MGFNLEGKIKPLDKVYIKELEIRIARLENLNPKKKSKIGYNFDNILGNVDPKNAPWSF